MKSPFIAFLTVAILVACQRSLDCRATIIRHDRPAAKYRELGEAPAFQCVGKAAVEPKPGDKTKTFYGSAVLIAPRWVLTAGHVAAKAPPEKMRYTFGGEQYRAIRCVPRPAPQFPGTLREAALAGIAAGADLALVELDRPVRNVRPAERYRGKEEVGRTMTKVGHGCIGDGLAGMKLPPTQEWGGGNNVIDAAGAKLGKLVVSENVLLCDFDHPSDPTLNRLGAPTPLELEVGISKGDSGGGWFIEEGGSWKLVAITSGNPPPTGDPGDPGSEKYGAVMAGVRVSTANQWIDGVIGASATPTR